MSIRCRQRGQAREPVGIGDVEAGDIHRRAAVAQAASTTAIVRRIVRLPAVAGLRYGPLLFLTVTTAGNGLLLRSMGALCSGQCSHATHRTQQQTNDQQENVRKLHDALILEPESAAVNVDPSGRKNALEPPIGIPRAPC